MPGAGPAVERQRPHVKLTRDDASNIADLQWRDVNRTDGDRATRHAQWAPHAGADNINGPMPYDRTTHHKLWG